MEKRIEEFDVAVIGGGAAGMTAALYAGRARLKTILIEKSLIGGLATYTSEIENYPGFPEGIDGTELMKLMDKQFRKFGVKVKLTDVKGIEDRQSYKVVSTFRTDYHVKAVVIATGGRPRLTGAKNEDQYCDKGISFCATCDAARYTGKKVMVIGSGDAAIEEGMFLTKFASEVLVSVIHDEGVMDANEVAQEKALKNEKTEALLKKLADETVITVPESMIQAELDSRWRGFVRQFGGISEEQLMKFMEMQGSTKESIQNEWRDDAISTIRTQLIMDRIREKENFEISDEELNAECEKQLKNVPDSEKDSYKDMIKDEMQFAKVLPFLLEKNTFKDGEKKSYSEYLGL